MEFQRFGDGGTESGLGVGWNPASSSEEGGCLHFGSIWTSIGPCGGGFVWTGSPGGSGPIPAIDE